MIYKQEIVQSYYTELDELSPLSIVKWGVSNKHLEYYIVSIVSVEKLIGIAERTAFFPSSINDWKNEAKKEAYIAGFKHTRIPPIVHLREESIKRKKYYFFGQTIVEKLLYIEYSNGRHRTRFMSDLGAKTMPILHEKKDLGLVKMYLV